ncbi:hypothetical protein Hanom_Chr11g01041171 [Helianthus anomalus]
MVSPPQKSPPESHCKTEELRPNLTQITQYLQQLKQKHTSISVIQQNTLKITSISFEFHDDPI